MGDRLALLIGSGKYPEETELADLQGPANDVRQMQFVLEKPDIGGFRVETFIDADSYQILPSIEATLSSSGPEDVVLVYYSGHGKLDLRGGLYLGCRNTRLATLQSTTVPLSFIKTVFDNAPCRNAVFLFDCCFSGAAAKAWVRGSVSDQFTVLGTSGVHILTSSTDFETSLEREGSEGGEVVGDFTKEIVEGLWSGKADMDNDGAVTPGDLHRYVQSRLPGQSSRYWSLESSSEVVLARNRRVQAAELPEELAASMKHPYSSIRKGAVEHLGKLLSSGNRAEAVAAKEALELFLHDDSRSVVAAASDLLARVEARERVGSEESLQSEIDALSETLVGIRPTVQPDDEGSDVEVTAVEEDPYQVLRRLESLDPSHRDAPRLSKEDKLALILLLAFVLSAVTLVLL